MNFFDKLFNSPAAPTTMEAAAALFGADREGAPIDGELSAKTIKGNGAKVNPRSAIALSEKALASRQAEQRMAVDVVIGALEASQKRSLTLGRYGDTKSILKTAGYTDMTRGTPMAVGVLRNLVAMEKGCFTAAPRVAAPARWAVPRDEKSAGQPQTLAAPAPVAQRHAVAVSGRPVQAAAGAAAEPPVPTRHLEIAPPPAARRPAYKVTPRPGQGRAQVQEARAPLPTQLVTTKVKVTG